MYAPPEALLLLRYVSGRPPHTDHVQLYLDALRRHHLPPSHRLDRSVLHSMLLLGALDAASRLLYPQCKLQQKLLIAAAIVECDPASAEDLLPRTRSRIGIVWSLTGLGLRIALKWLLALPLLCIPGFLQRNAGTE